MNYIISNYYYLINFIKLNIFYNKIYLIYLHLFFIIFQCIKYLLLNKNKRYFLLFILFSILIISNCDCSPREGYSIWSFFGKSVSQSQDTALFNANNYALEQHTIRVDREVSVINEY